MATTPIWPGSSSFMPGQTPFGFYDNDAQFRQDADKVAKFCANRMGYPLVDIELQSGSFYTAFEEAVTTYGNLVYQYKIRDQYLNMEGSPSAQLNNATVTYVDSIDINSPVNWSGPRWATQADIEYNATFSQSVDDGNVYIISASVSDFVLPNKDYVKSITFATEYTDSVSGNIIDLSAFVYNQLNRLGGPTVDGVITPGESYVYVFTSDYNIAGGSPIFGGNTIPTIYIQDSLEPELNNKILSNNLATLTTTIAEDYASETGVGGKYTVLTGSVSMSMGVQDYDLNVWAAASASLDPGDRIEIRRIFYEEPPAIVRYFDPYAGTGTGIQSLLETFGFGQFSPGVNFLLMPIHFDVGLAGKLEKVQPLGFLSNPHILTRPRCISP